MAEPGGRPSAEVGLADVALDQLSERRLSVFRVEDPTELDELEVLYPGTSVAGDWYSRYDNRDVPPSLLTPADRDSGSDTSSGGSDPAIRRRRRARIAAHRHHKDEWVDTRALDGGGRAREAPRIAPSMWWRDWEEESSDADMVGAEAALREHSGAFGKVSRQLDVRQHLLCNRAAFETERKAVIRNMAAALSKIVVPSGNSPDTDWQEEGVLMAPGRSLKHHQDFCCCGFDAVVKGPVHLSAVDLAGSGTEWGLGKAPASVGIESLMKGQRPRVKPGMKLKLRNARVTAAPVAWQCKQTACLCCRGCGPCTCEDSGKFNLEARSISADVRFDAGVGASTQQVYVHAASICLGGLRMSVDSTRGCCGCADGPGLRYLRLRQTQPRGKGGVVSLACVQFFSVAAPDPPGENVLEWTTIEEDVDPLNDPAVLASSTGDDAQRCWQGDSGAVLYAELGAAAHITGYRIQTGSGPTSKDAACWVLEGAEDLEGPWTLLHQQTRAADVPQGRFAWSPVMSVGSCCSRWRCSAPQCCMNLSLCCSACCVSCIAGNRLEQFILTTFPPPGPEAQLME